MSVEYLALEKNNCRMRERSSKDARVAHMLEKKLRIIIKRRITSGESKVEEKDLKKQTILRVPLFHLLKDQELLDLTCFFLPLMLFNFNAQSSSASWQGRGTLWCSRFSRSRKLRQFTCQGYSYLCCHCTFLLFYSRRDEMTQSSFYERGIKTEPTRGNGVGSIDK